MSGQLCTEKQFSGNTFVNNAIFSFVFSSRTSAHLSANISGNKPRLLSVVTPCCVGLVFCSPKHGTKETNPKQQSSRGNCCINWRIASKNIELSISPTVPPTSTKQISAKSPFSLIGICETLNIHS